MLMRKQHDTQAPYHHGVALSVLLLSKYHHHSHHRGMSARRSLLAAMSLIAVPTGRSKAHVHQHG